MAQLGESTSLLEELSVGSNTLAAYTEEVTSFMNFVAEKRTTNSKIQRGRSKVHLKRGLAVRASRTIYQM